MTVIRVPTRGVRFLLRFGLAVLLLLQLYCAAFLLPDSLLPPVRDYRSSSIFSAPAGPEVQIIEATAYCSCPICCGAFSDGRTASGSWATAGRTLAADTTLFGMGTCLAFEFGHRTVEDTGRVILGGIVDIYFDTHQEALEFGRRFISFDRC